MELNIMEKTTEELSIGMIKFVLYVVFQSNPTSSPFARLRRPESQASRSQEPEV